MSRTFIIALLVIGTVVLLAVVAPTVGSALAKGAASKQCAELRSQYDEAVRQQDAPKIRELEGAIADCNRDLEALGVGIDPGLESLKACQFAYGKTEDWWQIYIGTDWADSLKRNNNYDAITRANMELAQCVTAALPIVKGIEGINLANQLIDRALMDSKARENCHSNTSPGYGCGGNTGRQQTERATQLQLEPVKIDIARRKAALGV